MIEAKALKKMAAATAVAVDFENFNCNVAHKVKVLRVRMRTGNSFYAHLKSAIFVIMNRHLEDSELAILIMSIHYSFHCLQPNETLKGL